MPLLLPRAHRRHLVATLTCLVLGLGFAPLAQADIVIPGQKKVKVTVTADLGPWAHYSSWRYKVRAGDTLSQIAQAQLGTTKRWKEIEKLNPKVSPERLEPGTLLEMPSRKIPHGVEGAAEGAKPLTHFFSLPGGGHFGNEMRPLGHNEVVAFHHYGTSLVAIRHAVLPKVMKALKARTERTSLGTALEAWAGKPGIAMLKGRVGGYESEDEESPISSIKRTVRVVGMENGVLTTKVVASQGEDEEGKPVGALGLVGGTRWILLLLSFVGLLALIFFARHRGLEEEDSTQGMTAPTA